MICVSVAAPTMAEMRRRMHRAAEVADIIELRIDSLVQSVDLEALLADRPRPVIVTCRPRTEGGGFAGPERRRRRILQQAIHLGANYVDVELSAVGSIRREPGTKLIVSVHDFQGTPPDLSRIHRRILATGADIAKIATTANSITDNLRIFELLVSATTPTIALCMGEKGLISRVLGRKFGAALTYACLERGEETAPGQIPASDLRNIYRYQTINQHTEVFGVIGNPVAHSLSPLVHNLAFDQRGMNAVYLPFLVEDVVSFVRAFREIGARGYSVTLPHKERALEVCDEVEETARRVGSVNTLVEEGEKLRGANTDYQAALLCMERVLIRGGSGRRTRSPLRGKRVAVVGAGGVARTIAFAAVDHGAKVAIYNRTLRRARALAEEIGPAATAHPLREITRADYHLLVNATPVGMSPDVDRSPVPVKALKPGRAVFDTVYTPLETRLLREAREVGCRTVGGLDMFIAQAARQFEIWTGAKAPVRLMKKAALQRLRSPAGAGG